MCDIDKSTKPTLTKEEQIEKRKESQRLASKRFYEKNKEKVLQHHKEYIKANKEDHNKRSREYQRKKSEQLRELKDLKEKLNFIESLLSNKLLI